MWHKWQRCEVHTGFWLEKPKRKRQLGKPRHRWEGNIKMNLKEVGWSGLDSSSSRQGPVVDSCKHG